MVLAPKRTKGVFLGMSAKNSSWMIGTMKDQSVIVEIYETRSANFFENILVRDMKALYESDPPLAPNSGMCVRMYENPPP